MRNADIGYEIKESVKTSVSNLNKIMLSKKSLPTHDKINGFATIDKATVGKTTSDDVKYNIFLQNFIKPSSSPKPTK
ncbi:MAG: hypothetical protein HQ490_03890 [Lutibacter sp.]|nr:hypothetical protein [Lutibacter sp.]